MPNHVESTLDFKGPVDQLEKMLILIRGKGNWDSKDPSLFNFDVIIPMPQAIIDAHKKDNTNDEWYHWCVNNWGTKWGAYSVSLYKHLPANSVRLIKQMANKKAPPGMVRICFQTAWSPATPIVQKLSEMFPEVSMTYAYIDEGNGFACLEKWLAGTMVKGKDDAFPSVRRKLRTFPKCLEGVEPETDEED